MSVKKSTFYTTLLFIYTLCWSCSSSEKSGNAENQDKTGSEQVTETAAIPVAVVHEDGSMELNGLKLTPVKDSPGFEDAKITMTSPQVGDNLSDTVVQFSFGVENYDLAAQTPDATDKLCANSGKGQHIHLILNNEPYTAHYESDFTKTLERGHYTCLAFLSRSYHESIKSKDAYVLTEFNVGQELEQGVNLESELLIYSRPKGQYVGDETKKLLLDFYLVNTSISPTGKKVRATINGNIFMITKWQPYFIEGLPMGDVKIKLELLDEQGDLIQVAFNPSERTVNLMEATPGAQ